MNRQVIDPAEYDVSLSKDDFLDLMVDEFNEYTRGTTALDELLLHPKDALVFCDHVRRKHGFEKLPDDVILRSIIQRRKNPRGG